MAGIQILRPAAIEDTYGDAKAGKTTAGATFEGRFAPANPAETVTETRSSQVLEGMVYIRTATPTGIRSSDLLSIDGVRYQVDGKPMAWESKGEQIRVKAVTNRRVP